MRHPHKDNRHIGVRLTQDTHEGLAALQDDFRGAVGHVVQHEHGRILHARHQLRHLGIEPGVAAETEVHHLAVQPAAEYVGEGHAGTRHAASLEDGSAVHHHRCGPMQILLRDKLIPGVDAYLQL